MLIFPLFLAILFIGCQAYENKVTGGESASFNLRLNDVPYYSNNIGESGSKFNLVSGYVENKDLQKRQVRKSSAKSKSSKKVTSKKSKTASSQYIKMKYKLYNDINALRVEHAVPKLKVNVTLSKELQKYVEGLVKVDQTYKYQLLEPEDLYYIVKRGEKYDPIGFWSKDLKLFKPDDKIIFNLPLIKLIWKSSTHIGCGISGANNSRGRYRIIVYCRISPRRKIPEELSENILLN
uniref:SCP domain-containing protein n=1 Tax=Strongyloides papillosus TaxID=174720 RepID=A0A0N5CAZ0_STREA